MVHACIDACDNLKPPSITRMDPSSAYVLKEAFGLCA